ncbi:MAG: ABC transporter substrate-binding protein, partial [Schwartzia sp.]|nr:ABC transporter substrate-binding protein [Schwartzia sp. (in: firmicutes)]
DNVIARAMPTLLSVTDPAKKPVICGEENMVKAGGLATYGIDYYKLGLQTGDMGADILDGKHKPAEMPIQTAKDLKASINKKNADALGVKIPDDLMKSAEIIQ